MEHQLITAKIDRPLGSAHPDYPEMIYPINYGYVEGLLAQDGEEQDVYILGADIPVEEFTGKLIAVVHRSDDVEDKWVACPVDVTFTQAEIEQQIKFSEQYYNSHIEML